MHIHLNRFLTLFYKLFQNKIIKYKSTYSRQDKRDTLQFYIKPINTLCRTLQVCTTRKDKQQNNAACCPSCACPQSQHHNNFDFCDRMLSLTVAVKSHSINLQEPAITILSQKQNMTSVYQRSFFPQF